MTLCLGWYSGADEFSEISKGALGHCLWNLHDQLGSKFMADEFYLTGA
jgi:hypothetical protein